MPSAPLETRVFIVNTGAMPTLNANRIEAAYYRTEGDFTTFKDVDNQPVYTVRNDQLMSVERSHDADPILTTFSNLLKQATDRGRATGTVKAKRPVGHNGAFYTEDFVVTVAANECADAPTPAPDVVVSVGGNATSESDLSKAVRKGMQRGPGQSGI